MPDVASSHFDAALTNLSIAYRNPAYVAQQIAPEVAVRRQSNRYFIYDPKRDAMRQTFDGRAPGAEAHELDFQLSSDLYYCDDHALESAIPDEESENADSPLQPQVDRVEFLTDKILLNKEIALATKLRDTAVIPNTSITPWSDPGADPMADIETGRTAIISQIQQPPNTLLLSAAAYTSLRNAAKVIERVKYTNGGTIGTKALADLFDVEHVLVARAVKNTSAVGQNPSLQPVWGSDALLMHVPARVSLKATAAALTFSWSQAAGTRGVSVQAWREERRKATMVRVQQYYDLKIVAPGAAYLFPSAA
ncbi:major capsid protein [Candidatus Sumerlaeota bacterium]|nr:major capsid protein [Candidatus Sumerlaeota bacterium]